MSKYRVILTSELYYIVQKLDLDTNEWVGADSAEGLERKYPKVEQAMNNAKTRKAYDEGSIHEGHGFIVVCDDEEIDTVMGE